MSATRRVDQVLTHLGLPSAPTSALVPCATASAAPSGGRQSNAASSYAEEIGVEAARWKTDRFKHVTRPYTPEEVVRLRSPMTREYAGTKPADKLWTLLSALHPQGKFSHTFGCLDTVQVTQMAKYLTTIYVSGWQSSSTASTTNEPGVS